VKDVPTIATVQRPRPAEPLAGRVAFFTTAPAAAHGILAEELGAVAVSGNLADRGALRDDLERIDADVFLVELKAAAIDVVAEAAAERGIPVVLADADVRTVRGEPDLDEALLALVREPEPSLG
jgi:cyclic 2,3-diphosphoglycerate synthetase